MDNLDPASSANDTLEAWEQAMSFGSFHSGDTPNTATVGLQFFAHEPKDEALNTPPAHEAQVSTKSYSKFFATTPTPVSEPQTTSSCYQSSGKLIL